MDFTEEQKRYLDGLGRGFAAARAALTTTVAAPAGAEGIHLAAQNRFLAAGKTLVKEEDAKRARHGLDMWDVIAANAAKGEFPKGSDVFLYKFHGLFHVAPTQDSFMLRLRIPNGIVDAAKLRTIADLADDHGGGYAHVTTRANLQIREIGPRAPLDILQRLAEAGLSSRGAGADNVRNITGGPTAGIDAQELYDTRSLGLSLHHAILNHRELYGLPRKFNIAFDGGGAVSSLEDTNDIGFSAVRVAAGQRLPEGIYFRVAVGGITGHGDFAGDLGVALRPEQCVPVALAMLRVFIDEGDRTERKRARLKYVLDRLGHEAFLAAAEKLLDAPLPRLPLAECAPRPALRRDAHLGFHAQSQPGRVYCGVALPLGRMTAMQMRGIAEIASRYGSGIIRLSVWQSLIVSDIAPDDQANVQAALTALGLAAAASKLRGAFVACTGNTGCRFAASDTKRHALETLTYLERQIAFDAPLNIHFTGCAHSCAQHYIGDIGLLGTKIAGDADSEIEAYHVYLGGGYGERRALAREVWRDVAHAELPKLIERLLCAYLAQRHSARESFQEFTQRHSPETLRAFVGQALAEAA